MLIEVFQVDTKKRIKYGVTVCVQRINPETVSVLEVLYLYRFCIILVSPFNWLCYVFNVKMKNLAFDTSTIISA